LSINSPFLKKSKTGIPLIENSVTIGSAKSSSTLSSPKTTSLIFSLSRFLIVVVSTLQGAHQSA